MISKWSYEVIIGLLNDRINKELQSLKYEPDNLRSIAILSDCRLAKEELVNSRINGEII